MKDARALLRPSGPPRRLIGGACSATATRVTSPTWYKRTKRESKRRTSARGRLLRVPRLDAQPIAAVTALRIHCLRCAARPEGGRPPATGHFSSTAFRPPQHQQPFARRTGCEDVGFWYVKRVLARRLAVRPRRAAARRDGARRACARARRVFLSVWPAPRRAPRFTGGVRRARGPRARGGGEEERWAQARAAQGGGRGGLPEVHQLVL